ncbi:molecular chaperone DnaJ [Candidatus Uhrbacteria bacterium]|nr:molecular chaperone DnaJ [Candidatus Uhrbacteria bacterium]
MAGKDYYHILGVGKQASAEEIKKAFRTLAHQFHPDKPGGNADKFKEINAAYQVLSDPDKRAKYDQFGPGFEQMNGGDAGGFGGFQNGFNGMEFDLGDLGSMFGQAFGFGGGRRGEGGGRKQGRPMEVALSLTFSEAIFGVEKEIILQTSVACERCGGVGAEPGTKKKTCTDCGGTGTRVRAQRTILGTIQMQTTCDTCQGEGEIIETPCASCRGEGMKRGKKQLSIEIPAGVEDGAVLRLRGQGEAIKGGEAGDVYVRLRVTPDARFERDGDKIYSGLSIGFTQAALGDKVIVETVDGDAELTIPAGIQSGTELRLKGKGVPQGRGRGDHMVVVTVVTPTKLSREQKELFETLNLRD